MAYELTAVTPLLRIPWKTIEVAILSFCYALFVVFFPWEEITKGGFSDFDQYVQYYNYFNTHNLSISDKYKLGTLLEYFSREVLWHGLVAWLTGVTGEASIALRIISFFILFVWGLLLFKRVHYGVALLFLFNPFLIDVAMSGIRNGLAWSLFMVGLFTPLKGLRGVLFLAGIFIHSATLVLVVFYYCIQWASRFIKGKTLLLVGLGIGVFIGLMLTVGSELFLGTIGDRRQGAYLAGRGSFLMASLWAIFLCFQCMSGRDYINNNILITAVLAWYLTMNFYIPSSYRIWSAFLPVIAISVINLSPQKRQFFMYLYSGYVVLLYLYWTKLFYYWYPALSSI